MAKQNYGILDGYRGTVGTVIGYQWRGRWCLKARPRRVHNPRTEAQQEHRMLFRDMVQLASRMTPALRYGLRTTALEEKMTEGNLFVKMNKDCFSPQNIVYESLQISYGPVAPVAFTHAEVDEEMVLHVEFEKNPLHLCTSGDDEVRVYAYCPTLQRGVLSAAAYRKSKRLSMSLPDEFADRDLHFYGFVTDYTGRASETMYILLDNNPYSDYSNYSDYSDYSKLSESMNGDANTPSTLPTKKMLQNQKKDVSLHLLSPKDGA